ncbi:MAG TPA: FAD-dependent oxidoreductase [Acidimicrobiales bacterium]|nr:FAD-dependent oxidoreductase [Acidimicrobiales bacterium]
MSQRIVIVGASLAGLRAAENLRSMGHDGPLTLVGEERHRPYDRPPLSKQVLTGKTTAEGTSLGGDEALGAEWVLGTQAIGVDLDRRIVHLAGHEDLPFDGLVIATGAAPRLLPLAPPGPGVHYLRTLDDSLALRDELGAARAVAVIGAGFIGLEVAVSAQQLGVAVTVLEALPVPLERALGADVGRQVMEWHRSKGLEIRAGAIIESIEGNDRPHAIRLADGTEIAADTIVVGVGVAPATEWLEDTGVDLHDGVRCDSRLRVLSGGRPVPGVVAAGDVARWDHPGYGESVRVEHWTNATEAAETAARTLLADLRDRPGQALEFAPVPYFWSDQHGVKLQFVGRAAAGDETRLLEGSFDDDRLLIAYGRAGRLVGALGIRRPRHVMDLQRRMAGGDTPFPPEI